MRKAVEEHLEDRGCRVVRQPAEPAPCTFETLVDGFLVHVLRLRVRYSLESFHQYSQPQSEKVPKRAITARNGGRSRRAITARNGTWFWLLLLWCGLWDGVWSGDIMVRNWANGGAVRLWCGTGTVAGLYHHGADWKVVLGLAILRCGL